MRFRSGSLRADRSIFFVHVLLLKQLVRVFRLSFDDYDFNLLIIGKQISNILALRHVKHSLLNCRHS